MRAVWASLALVMFLLSGCADGGKPATPATVDEALLPDGTSAARAHRLAFAAGDSEAQLADQATFPAGAMCVIDVCPADPEQVFDLTSIVPADAPVELTIEAVGQGYLELQLVDANVIDESQEFGGQGATLAALLTRSEAGTVHLVVRVFGFPPEPEGQQVSFEATSVVRADLLVPGVPAAMKLQPGDTLNVTGDVGFALFLAPDGSVETRETGPFLFTANGTAGEYTLLIDASEPVAVYGPNVTMTARRVVYTDGEPHALASGAATTWTFTPASRPLLVGLTVQTTPDATLGLGLATAVQSLSYKLTAPDAFVLLDESPCSTTCGFSPVGMQGYGGTSEFLDPHLTAGAYTASVTFTGASASGMRAYEWVMTIA